MSLGNQQYAEQAQELIQNENILLQTLGFDVAIDHPHTQVLKCCQHLFRGKCRPVFEPPSSVAASLCR